MCLLVFVRGLRHKKMLQERAVGNTFHLREQALREMDLREMDLREMEVKDTEVVVEMEVEERGIWVVEVTVEIWEETLVGIEIWEGMGGTSEVGMEEETLGVETEVEISEDGMVEETLVEMFVEVTEIFVGVRERLRGEERGR